MLDLKIRASSVGRIMTNPRTKAEGILSVGAKTYLRELAKQEILGIEFEVSSKEMEKGIATLGRIAHELSATSSIVRQAR